MVKNKINNLTRNIFHKILDHNDQPLEYGNMRRSDEWGVYKDKSVQWVILVDIIIGKPIHYIIDYSFSDKKYSCYAMTEKNSTLNVFQFSTTDIHELDYRLTELANHIPSLRERRLREYLYNEYKNAPGRRWFGIFSQRWKTEDYLNGKIESLYSQGRISQNELTRLQNYIANLI